MHVHVTVEERENVRMSDVVAFDWLDGYPNTPKDPRKFTSSLEERPDAFSKTWAITPDGKRCPDFFFAHNTWCDNYCHLQTSTHSTPR